MPPGRVPAPLGLASSVSRRTAQEVEGGLQLGPARQRPSAPPFKLRWFLPDPLSPCVGALPEAAFDVTSSARAAEPLGRPTIYLPPCAQDKVKSYFLFLFPVSFKNP